MADAQTCQRFCKDLYPTTCTWFMFDRTTSDCKLFKGSLTGLKDDCREQGYPVDPPYDQCEAIFDESSEVGCRVSKNSSRNMTYMFQIGFW